MNGNAAKPKERFGSGQPADHMRRPCLVILNLNRYATTDERLRYREWDHALYFRAHEPGLQAGAVIQFLSGSGSGSGAADMGSSASKDPGSCPGLQQSVGPASTDTLSPPIRP